MMQESLSEDTDCAPNFDMLATRKKLQDQIKSITQYLTPLLPLANCHMVEFFTENHWDNLVPENLRKVLDSSDETWDFNFTLRRFWDLQTSLSKDSTELATFIVTSRRHCLTVNEYCLSTDQIQDKITSWGGSIQPEINITAFMNSKKSYEVATMSRLAASLYQATGSTCCLEAGGGRGHLLVALSLGYHIPSLTVDCDEVKLRNAAARVRLIQKQWNTISKRGKEDRNAHYPSNKDKQNWTSNTHSCDENQNPSLHHPNPSPHHSNPSLHRFAMSYITKDTDLVAVVEDKFPELTDNAKLLLTGLHTCGDLGPSSLRIFTSNSSTRAVFNVPCCYHLLTEDCGEDAGFPMSTYLKGFKLGRNARMLAAQSLDRVVSERQLPPRSLLYRALLQVLIKSHLPNAIIPEGKLKRLSSKCVNFEQYFKMANAILNLGLHDSLSQSCLTEICKEIDCQWRKLVIFYLLRLCLAQVVESVILLDRIMFLLENDCEKVYLVKLFDPVLSPRCHGIVAVR